jgi:tetratricopeptide (TPR) repeat protein
VLNALVEANGEMAITLPALYAAAGTRPVRNARDGIAEAYLALAGALRGPETNDFVQLLLRLALDLRPDMSAARLLSADILDSLKQPEAALAMLRPVPDDDPLSGLVRLRQVALMDRTGDTTGALALTDTLARRYPDRPEPLSMRGDILRGKKRFADSVAAYDQAISRVKQPRRGDWVLFYERGIANERSQNWTRAEADFQRALELSPGEPFVLNYLAYSWTEQGRNLARARAMIEEALQKRPNDGAIIDSLGWIALRQGHTAEAVGLLERATELDPSDPTINFHLGDAYWAAGRKLLAQFQWRRALTLNPDADDVPKLQAKLRESERALGNLPIAATEPAAPPAATP